MTMTKVYTCNLCQERKGTGDLIGLYFSGNTKFTLTNAHKTDGQHICFNCAGQLRAQLPSYPLQPSERGES